MISLSISSSIVTVSVQGLTIVFILFGFLMLQYKIKPYNSSELNHMEIEGLSTATLTLYCGVYYMTGDLGDIATLCLFILIVIGNGYFIIYWLY